MPSGASRSSPAGCPPCSAAPWRRVCRQASSSPRQPAQYEGADGLWAQLVRHKRRLARSLFSCDAPVPLGVNPFCAVYKRMKREAGEYAYADAPEVPPVAEPAPVPALPSPAAALGPPYSVAPGPPPGAPHSASHYSSWLAQSAAAQWKDPRAAATLAPQSSPPATVSIARSLRALHRLQVGWASAGLCAGAGRQGSAQADGAVAGLRLQRASPKPGQLGQLLRRAEPAASEAANHVRRTCSADVWCLAEDASHSSSAGVHKCSAPALLRCVEYRLAQTHMIPSDVHHGTSAHSGWLKVVVNGL